MKPVPAKAALFFKTLFWLVPCGILLWAYFYLVWVHGDWALWNRVIHENGKYTLLQTLFYFDHFVREIPVCVLTGAVAAFSFLLYAPPAEPTRNRSLRTAGGFFFLAAAVFAVVSFLAAARKVGIDPAWQDLFQFRIREGEISFGAHWRGHLLHILFVFVLSLGVSFALRASGMPARVNPNPTVRIFLLGWTSVFLALELYFSGTGEAIVLPGYLAHQLREIVTHGSVTVPLCFLALMAMEGRTLSGGKDLVPPSHGLISKAFFCFLAAALVPLFILLQLRGIDLLLYAPKSAPIAELLASHYFEHSLDYLFTPLVALSCYGFIRGTSRYRYD